MDIVWLQNLIGKNPCDVLLGLREGKHSVPVIANV